MYMHTRRPLHIRLGSKIARVVLVLLLYCWIGQAIYLWADAQFYPELGSWARVYLAGRDAFHGLPEAILYVVGFCAQLISWGHSTLVSQLGYDPVAMPEIEKFEFGGAPPLTFEGLQSVEISGISAQAVYGVLLVGLGLSLVQFAVLFLLSAIGVVIGWKYPAVPKILHPSAGVIYLIVTYATAAWLVYEGFIAAVVAGIAGCLVAMLLLWTPIIAGLPLWLLYVFGLRPQALASIPLAIFDYLRRLGPNIAYGTTASDSRKETIFGEKAQREHDEPHTNTGLSTQGIAEDRVNTACGTLSISPEEFKNPQFAQRTLVSRFHELAKKLHPDTRGSERLMAILNEDYEFLLTYKGWTR